MRGDGSEVITGLEELLRAAGRREKELLDENERLARALAEAPSSTEERATSALEKIADATERIAGSLVNDYGENYLRHLSYLNREE